MKPFEALSKVVQQSRARQAGPLQSARPAGAGPLQTQRVVQSNKSPKMQPRLNEKSITGGIQETNRRDIQGGDATSVGVGLNPSNKVSSGTQSGYKSYQANNRLQGGVTGTGNNTMKPYQMKKR